MPSEIRMPMPLFVPYSKCQRPFPPLPTGRNANAFRPSVRPFALLNSAIFIHSSSAAAVAAGDSSPDNGSVMIQYLSSRVRTRWSSRTTTGPCPAKVRRTEGEKEEQGKEETTEKQRQTEEKK
ncbi:hypothetical protein niasHT_004565 [Heterodera trifolii]|uniref:Uncharacterized protein n=1 Tax=Heterodera trifolii TaxID=157864 RepID=A0ABD2M794_9BILA